jgi:hypothetical protein
MSWEGIEERLARSFTHRIQLPSGTVSLPDDDLTIEQWLISAAESDEELREIDIPAINFLQNLWPIESLAEFRWSKPLDKRSLVALYVRDRAYILFGNRFEYHILAAVEPGHEPSLYRAVFESLLTNAQLMPERPAMVEIRRPDLILIPEASTATDELLRHAFGGENFAGLGGPVDWMHPGEQTRKAS